VQTLHAVHIFRVALLGPQNKPRVGSNAHLQECGDDGVGPSDGNSRLIGNSDGLVVLREDAQCMAG
jgi:hypothetical protein